MQEKALLKVPPAGVSSAAMAGWVASMHAYAVRCAAVDIVNLPCPCSAKKTLNFCAIILPRSGRSCHCFLATRPAAITCELFRVCALKTFGEFPPLQVVLQTLAKRYCIFAPQTRKRVIKASFRHFCACAAVAQIAILMKCD